jgi:hypothetical protein
VPESRLLSPKGSMTGLEKGHDSFRNELLATNQDKTPLAKLPIREGYSFYMFILDVDCVCLLYLYRTNCFYVQVRLIIMYVYSRCLLCMSTVSVQN